MRKRNLKTVFGFEKGGGWIFRRGGVALLGRPPLRWSSYLAGAFIFFPENAREKERLVGVEREKNERK